MNLLYLALIEFSGFNELTDQELVEKLKKGSSLAFKAIYYRYYDNLYSFLSSKIREDIAEDLTQDSFCKLWENRKTLKSDSYIKSFLFTIGLNLFRDHIKKKSASEKSTDDLSIYDKVEEENEILIKIKQSIEEMDDKIQSAFILSKYEGYKYHEIAEILGVSVKTVENYLSKALAHLRKNVIIA